VQRFLARYGMRGVGEIDFGRPRWRENPLPVFQVLQSYAQITDPDQAPDVQFARGARAAEAALTRLAEELRGTHGGKLKAQLVRVVGRRMRIFAGLRELPKFTIIRLFGMARTALLRAGQIWTEQGVLAARDDMFYLHLAELRALAAGESRDWKGLVRERRAAYRRELGRRQIPRILLSDGRSFYAGLGAEGSVDGLLVGSPVSPGVVEGVVRVILDPQRAQLSPGEILVCPATDPGWTPLFLAAGGLVMEIGGLMTHGAVVAREYGIPAVVGVHDATQRLKTGQRVRVDGSSGVITPLEE
jgi:phosphohistidine swiveling domain-containing protein